MQKINRAVLFTAFLARLTVFCFAANGFFLVGEGAVQADIAENLLSGRGLMLSESMLHSSDPVRDSALEFFRETGGFYGALIPGRPTSFLVPGYAFFEAFVFMITSPGNLPAVVAVQLALGVLTVYLGMKLASRFLFGRWYIAAGFLMALDPFQIYYEAIPATQALFSLLFAAGLLLSLRFMEKPGKGRAIAAGLSWGAAFMVRPAALPMIAWLLLVFLLSGRFSRKKLFQAGVAVLVFLVCVAPWMVRNKAVMGKYQLLPLQGGVQLWEYNGRIFTRYFENEQEGAKLLYGPVRSIWAGRINKPELAEFPDFTVEGEFQRDSILTARQMEFLKVNPGLFLHLATCRFAEFFKPFPLNVYSPAHTVTGLLSFFWVGIFFASGTILMLKRGSSGVFMAGVIGGYILIHLLTASGTPHRVALDIPLFIAALTGLKHAVARIEAGREKA